MVNFEPIAWTGSTVRIIDQNRLPEARLIAAGDRLVSRGISECGV